MNNILFTGNIDVDRQILYLVDDFDLYQLYYTSKYARKIILFSQFLQKRFIFFKRQYLELIQNLKTANRNKYGQVHVKIESYSHVKDITKDDILFILPEATHIDIEQNRHYSEIMYDIDDQDLLSSIKSIVTLLGYDFEFERVRYAYYDKYFYYIIN